MNFKKFLLNLLASEPVYAHCDIPCGIYDPFIARQAAKTVYIMVQKINELSKNYPLRPRSEASELPTMNSLVRMVMVKEKHAELCKKEILILWTDYFKKDHLEKFPNLHEIVWKTTKLCSENKRDIDEAKAEELIKAVDKVAEIFEQTKK